MNTMTVSYAPHIRDKITTGRIMLDVIIALIPAFAASVIIFGARAALVTGVCVASCVLFEWAYQKIMRKTVTVGDLSAVITGMLLAFNLPVSIPIWQAVFGSGVAIIFVKQLFGGIGKNFANPAITARVVMFLAFPAAMTHWGAAPDAVSAATPLMLIARGDFASLPDMWSMFIGTRGGCLGETSAFALLAGGIYLLARRVITWHTPVAFIGTVAALTAVFGGLPGYHILAGGLILGAFFMATDYPTTPQTSAGRIIFGVGCGALTVVIRLYGSYPEGVSFAILLMNMFVPYINKLTLSKPLGGVKKA
ncbi:MAG: RnfABCDGE type electron transport complex subunit D [Oscillospiraceae bacterium]|nr:RnfABCDGE type electron transport complex subunit D [Oscillospiraceae bacterium]